MQARHAAQPHLHTFQVKCVPHIPRNVWQCSGVAGAPHANEDKHIRRERAVRTTAKGRKQEAEVAPQDSPRRSGSTWGSAST